MSLLMVGSKGSVETRWITYALLRDCVMHHLEGGRRTERFSALHGIAVALGSEAVRVPARKLHEELVEARTLLELPLEALALSNRTRAVLEATWPPTPEDSTSLVKDPAAEIPLLSGLPKKRLADVFGNLLETLLQISGDAAEGEQIEITDG